MRKTRQNQSEKISLSLLFRLTRKTVFFLFLFLLVLTFFYVIGNYQLFLDSSQTIILNTAVMVAAGLIFISFAGIIESVLCIIKKENKRLYYALNLIFMIFSLLVGVFFMFMFSTTLILSNGM